MEEVDRWSEREGVLCSVNRVAAGTDPIVLPERAVAEGAVWFRDGTVAEIYERLRVAALGAGALSTRRFGLQSNPAEIPVDHPLVRATTSAIAVETGITPDLYPASAPWSGNFYGPNEWVGTTDMHRATRVLVRIASAWADQTTKDPPGLT